MADAAPEAPDAPAANTAAAIDGEIEACSGVEQLFALAARLHDDNKRAAATVDARRNRTVTFFQYEASPQLTPDCDGCSFVLTEERVEELAGELLARWKADVHLVIPPTDLFNLRIDYSCHSYHDLVRLNKELFVAAERCYDVYDDDSKKGRVGVCARAEGVGGGGAGAGEGVRARLGCEAPAADTTGGAARGVERCWAAQALRAPSSSDGPPAHHTAP